MANSWLVPSYSGHTALTFTNASGSGYLTAEVNAGGGNALSFLTDLVFASGAATAIVSITLDNMAGTKDGILFGLVNTTWATGIARYPGDSVAGNTGIGYEPDGYVALNGVFTSLAVSTTTNGSQFDMEVNRGASTVRWRFGGGAWTAAQSISALGSGDLTVACSMYFTGDKVTLLSAGGGGSTFDTSALMMKGLG